MSELLEAFEKALESRSVPVEHSAVVDDVPAVRIPAASAEVGDLLIYDDSELNNYPDDGELTVAIGELHHSHFSPAWCEGSRQERIMRAAEHAAGYVADILDDKVQITVKYRGDQCVGSSSEYIDPHSGPAESIGYPKSAWFFRQSRKVSFTWSGRIQ